MQKAVFLPEHTNFIEGNTSSLKPLSKLTFIIFLSSSTPCKARQQMSQGYSYSASSAKFMLRTGSESLYAYEFCINSLDPIRFASGTWLWMHSKALNKLIPCKTFTLAMIIFLLVIWKILHRRAVIYKNNLERTIDILEWSVQIKYSCLRKSVQRMENIIKW